MKNNIGLYRFKKKISLQNLADGIGVARSSLWIVENGNRACSVVTALKIAKYFGVSVEDMFELEEEK